MVSPGHRNFWRRFSLVFSRMNTRATKRNGSPLRPLLNENGSRNSLLEDPTKMEEHHPNRTPTDASTSSTAALFTPLSPPVLRSVDPVYGMQHVYMLRHFWRSASATNSKGTTVDLIMQKLYPKILQQWSDKSRCVASLLHRRRAYDKKIRKDVKKVVKVLKIE